MSRIAAAVYCFALMSFGLGCGHEVGVEIEPKPQPEGQQPMTDEEKIDTLIGLAETDPETDDTGERKRGARALGRIGPPAKKAIPVLEKLLEDPDPEVSEAAKEALAKIRGGD